MALDPRLAADEIQAHVLPGFAGADLYLLAVAAEDAQSLRELLARLAPRVSWMDEGAQLRLQRKRFRLQAGPEPDDPLRLALALTRSGLDLLGQRERGVDRAFDGGMTGLRTGEPRSPTRADGSPEPAHPSHWKVGGPARRFELLVIAGAVHDIRGRAGEIADLVKSASGASVVYEEFGEDLPDSREHFGFVDGISGPGVYGYTERDGERQLVTTRYGVPPRDGLEFGKPGQPLVWPGRFIVGAPRAEGEPPQPPSPLWTNGSFLVFRRLEQDVAAFSADTERMAAELAAALGAPIDGEQLRSTIVGRRPNGQPLLRAGSEADAALAINHFFYASAAPPLQLADGSRVTGAQADLAGRICPVWAHVRKVNPRDGQNDLPEDAHNLQLLRRGIPFGPAYDFADPQAPGNAQPRGLLFLAYQRDIAEQFEKLNSHWMNQFEVPAAGGHDLLVGLALDPGGQRAPRRAEWPGSQQTLSATRSWVVPTGGAYLFAPSRSALALLTRPPADA